MREGEKIPEEGSKKIRITRAAICLGTTARRMQCYANIKNHYRNFPGHPVVKTALPLQWAWLKSLIRELRSHMPHGIAPPPHQKIIIIKKTLLRTHRNTFLI